MQGEYRIKNYRVEVRAAVVRELPQMVELAYREYKGLSNSDDWKRASFPINGTGHRKLESKVIRYLHTQFPIPNHPKQRPIDSMAAIDTALKKYF